MNKNLIIKDLKSKYNKKIFLNRAKFFSPFIINF